MGTMGSFLMILFVLNALALVGLVLIQHGKGADAGAAFGSGASATVFGSQGSSNFLSRSTGVLATLFFVLSLALANISGQKASDSTSVTETAPLVEESTNVPVMPAAPVDVPVAPAAPAPAPADVPTEQ